MPEHFVITNKATGLVMEGGNHCHGSNVVLAQRHGGHNQQWHVDHCSGTIRWRQNEQLCLDIECGHLVLHQHQPCKHDQQWERKGDLIVSRHDCNMVIAVAGCGLKLIKAPLHCAKNHCWTFETCSC